MTFREALQKYFTGDMDAAELRSILSAELQADAGSAWACLDLLDEIFGKGWLSVELHTELRKQITDGLYGGTPQPEPPAPPTGAGDAPPRRPDATRLRPSGQTGTGDFTGPSYTGASQPGASYPNASYPGASYPAASYPGAPATGSQFTGAPSTGFPDTGMAGSWTGGSSRSAPLGLGSTVSGQFVLEEEIGRGGMGVVYKALDLKAQAAKDRNPYVAIKLLSEEFKKHPDCLIQLQREAKKSQSLAHPNIVNVFIFNFDIQNAWIVMEYLDGQPLKMWWSTIGNT